MQRHLTSNTNDREIDGVSHIAFVVRDLERRQTTMNHTNLNAAAAALPAAWTSTVLSRVGGAKLKVLRMDGAAYPDEVHDYPEGFVVIDGQLNLMVAGEPVVVRAGELFVMPAGVAHAVAPGSAGTLLIVDV